MRGVEDGFPTLSCLTLFPPSFCFRATPADEVSGPDNRGKSLDREVTRAEQAARCEGAYVADPLPHEAGPACSLPTTLHRSTLLRVVALGSLHSVFSCRLHGTLAITDDQAGVGTLGRLGRERQDNPGVLF